MRSSAAVTSPATASSRALWATRKRSTELFYTKSWGKAWPTVRKALYMSDYVPPEGDTGNTNAEIDDAYGGDEVVYPRRHEYVCFEDMDLLENALLLSGVHPTAFVHLESYRTLVELMENDFASRANGFVVTGQPGIGKRTFLLYLLLYRLENRLPTAFQIHPLYFILFDSAGWALCCIEQPCLCQCDVEQDDALERLKACWALTDESVQPCLLFRMYSPCCVQVTSSSPNRWKPWAKHKQHTRTFIMNLPTEVEVAAVVKEHGHPLFAYQVPAMVRKWGPSLQMMLAFARAFKHDQLTIAEEKYEQAAINTANRIRRNLRLLPSSLWPGRFKLDSGYFPLLFICPASATIMYGWGLCVPTEHLQAILETACGDVSKELIMELFTGLSKRALTKPMRDHELELRMHARLCTGSDGLLILNGRCKRNLQPSTVLLPGILDGIKNVDKAASAGVYQSFYWIPAVIEFPGIDSVFGDDAGNLYALQVAAQGGNSDPVDGLSKLWKSVSKHVRERRSWHFVVVTNSRAAVKELMESYSDGLEFATGQRADVWAAVLSHSSL